ncbi:putative acetyltransferase [Metabacillus crassostreae]|uniref:GNAT family N-acetyltransferase n=1 Tax=Metabacillus crassostreae TaxID=929098 RepID=UPI0019586F21|nr:GNAT family N-acetyltransferase [Metabacillus crassostreae]MBM7603383.1 putative acetyltransferase [Metabacillus crassostreae]
MSSSLTLIKPTTDLKEEYLSFYDEWVQSKEEMIPWVIEKDPTNFDNMIQFLTNNEKGINLPTGWVPDSTYWLINEENRILGVVNIRHELTDFLLTRGGHIGYGIRPSERKKGYATKLLRLALEKTKKLGIKKVLVVCDEWNIGSYKTIKNNGGIEELDFVEDNGNVIKRFWIEE